MDVNERVVENLKTFGLTTNVKPITMKHLEKVDEVLEVMSKAQFNAIHIIKNSKITINKVAKESGIARQTFYNNPIITAYIEHYITTKTIISPYDLVDDLREKIRLKDKKIAGLIQRDATVSKYKAQYLELTDEIASLQATIKSQEGLIRKLRADKISRI